MNYLLVNHVPFGRGLSESTVRVGDLFLQDLRAQARAIRDAGGKLTVAAPLVELLDPLAGGSFNTIEITPADHGFEFVPLPYYVSMKQYLRARRELRAQLHKAIAAATVVQMDYGGHPVMLGQEAWPIATRAGAKRIWIFDGADPFPRLQRDAEIEPNPLKRLAKKIATQRKLAFCRDAIVKADLVFAHNAAVVERFKGVWNGHCYSFDRSFVTDEVLIDDAALEARKAFLRDTSRPLRLMSAGRQIRIKGTDQVIRAVAKLRARNVAVELDVMGDGDDLADFRRLAHDELKLGDAVRFTGTVPYGPALFDAWSSAHVMTITNLTAEISRNVLLALARGLPVITYENPGTDALLRDADAGIITPRGDVDALADAIESASKDRERLAQLAENGLMLARTKSLDATHRRRAELAAALVAKA